MQCIPDSMNHCTSEVLWISSFHHHLSVYHQRSSAMNYAIRHDFCQWRYVLFTVTGKQARRLGVKLLFYSCFACSKEGALLVQHATLYLTTQVVSPSIHTPAGFSVALLSSFFPMPRQHGFSSSRWRMTITQYGLSKIVLSSIYNSQRNTHVYMFQLCLCRIRPWVVITHSNWIRLQQVLHVLEDWRHLADNTLSGDGLSDNGQHKAHHSGTAVELLREWGEALWDLLGHHNGGRAAGRGRDDLRAGGEGRGARGDGRASDEGGRGDECGVHFWFGWGCCGYGSRTAWRF